MAGVNSKLWRVEVPLSENDMQNEIYSCVYDGRSFSWDFPIEPDEHGISPGWVEITFINEEEYED